MQKSPSRGSLLRKLIPSPSMGVALLALMVALSGTAYAAAKINGKNIKKGTVSSKQIKNNSVTGGDIRNGTIKTADVADGSLGAGDLAAGVIPTVPGPAPIGTATSTTGWAVTGLFGAPEVPGMSMTYTVPAGANKIVATFTTECQIESTVDDQSVVARIQIDGADAEPAGYSSICGPGDADPAANTGSGSEATNTSGVITRTLSAAPGAHTIQVQATQGLSAPTIFDNMSLVVISGS
jgi:hypothetical protein